MDKKNKTTEFSFVLKPSEYGVGVFSVHDISKGTHLRLFGDKECLSLRSVERSKQDVPELFQEYCMQRGDILLCPRDFGQMHVGWYLNHSQEPNLFRDSDYKWYAQRDIKRGEELLIDYNSLEEPLDSRGSFYTA
jgi:hypothetical protein